MNSKIYRCGWCGHPTDKDGNCLANEGLEKAKKIIDTYGDGEHTHLVEGECCVHREYCPPQPQMVQVTRDMAIDAQDLSLEGQWVRW